MTQRRMPSVVFLFIVALVVAPASRAQDAERVALVTDLEGSVLLATSGTSSFGPTTWGVQLFEGDQIKTLDDSNASILFSNGNLLTLGPNSSMTISSGPSTAEAGPVRTFQGEYVADASDMTLHRAGAGEIGALGGLRSGGNSGGIDPLSPRNTKIRSGRPIFSWHAGADFEIYTVKVLTESGTVWSTETTETHVAYPEDAAALAPATKYFWKVEGEEMLDVVTSPVVEFEVLTTEAASKIEAGETDIRTTFGDETKTSSYHFVLGSFYAKQGLLSDAIESFVAIASEHPDAARPQEILGQLYYEVGLKDDAIGALQRAIVLEQD